MSKAAKAFEQLKLAWEYLIGAIIFKLWHGLGVDNIKVPGGELVFIEEIEIKGSAEKQ